MGYGVRCHTHSFLKASEVNTHTVLTAPYCLQLESTEMVDKVLTGKLYTCPSRHQFVQEKSST